MTRRKTVKLVQYGDGFVGDLINKILPTRQQFPPKVRAIIQKYKDYFVKNIIIARDPIQSYVSNILSFLSGGKIDEQLKKLNYDKMYHLYMNVELVNGPDILVEKNEVVNMQVNNGKNASDTIGVSVNKKITFGELIDNAVKAVGPSIYLYDHINNNCQKFIRDILNSNGLLTSEANKFIMQDAEAILKTSPSYLNQIARFATEAKAKINRLIEGEGRKKKRGRPKGSKNKIPRNQKRKYKPKL